MDLGTATSTVGAETVVVRDRVSGPGATLQQTSLGLGTAFGDSVALSLAGREMVTFDSLRAPFWHPAGNLMTLATGLSQAARLREFLVLTFPVTAALSATALTTEGMNNRAAMADTSLMAHVWQFPDAPVRFRVGRAEEPRSLLGAEADGAFGHLSAGTTFAGIEADTRLGAWQMGFNAEAGTVNADTRDGLLDGVSDIATSAFSFHASRPTLSEGAFRVSFSQPLRIQSGHAELNLPVGRTKSGEVVRDAVTLGFEPSGRQLDLDLQWQHPLKRGNLHFGAVLSHEPGHRKHEDPALMVLTGWTSTF